MRDMALKLPRYFYLLMEKPLGRYFKVWSPYYQAAWCNHKNTYWESQKRININTNHSHRQCSSPWASVNWSNNKIWFSFRQPNRKRLGGRLVDVIKDLPHKTFLGRCWVTESLVIVTFYAIFLMRYGVIFPIKRKQRVNNCFKPLISSVFTTAASRSKSEQKEKEK